MSTAKKMFELQDKITTLRLKLQELSRKAGNHDLAIKQIDSDITRLTQQIGTLKQN